MLRTCNFCDTEYFPRPQVKNPKACPEKGCQAARQQANEQDWRNRNKSRYGSKYFRDWRTKVHLSKNRLKLELIESLKIGVAVRDRLQIDTDCFSSFISDFLANLGMRDVNKLCKP